MAIEAAALPKLLLDTASETPFYIPATGPQRGRAARSSMTTPSSCSTARRHRRLGRRAGRTFPPRHALPVHFELSLNGMQPLLLGSNVRDDNTFP